MAKRLKDYINTIKGSVSLVLFIALLLGLGLGISATTYAILSASQQIYLTSQNEISLFVSAVEEELHRAEDDMNAVIEDYWYAAPGQGDAGSLRFYSMINTMRAVRQKNVKRSAVFLLSGEKSWVGYDSNEISYAKGAAIRSALESGAVGPEHTRKPRFIELEGRYYLGLFIYNTKGNECIGVLYDIDLLPDGLSEGEQACNYFMDSEGCLYGICGARTDFDGCNIRMDGFTRFGKYIGIAAPSRDESFGIVRIMSRRAVFSNLSGAYILFLIMAVVIAAVIPVLNGLFDLRVYRPLSRLHRAMQEIEHDNLDYRMGSRERTREFEYTRTVFNAMADEIKDLRIRAYEEEIERLQIEATNLRLQVSPHMLQNSLNIIYNLSLSGNNRVIQQFVPCLSDYFRYSLELHGELAPIREEIAFVNNYIRVQKIRFPDRISFVYDVCDSIMEYKIPPLLIQNFVENTVKYGLKADEEIEIIILITKEERFLNLSIVDTGTGMSAEILEKLQGEKPYRDQNGEHIGIWNCRRRLSMIYGKDAKISIASEPNRGTQVWIRIPLEKEEDDEASDC